MAMAKGYKLSEGALEEIMNGAELKDPIMQVLGSKKVISNQSDKERFRLLLSDGKYYISYAMITIQIGDSRANIQIPDNSIIVIQRYITSIINSAGGGIDKRVLVILDFEILVKGNEIEKLGNPVVLPDKDVSTSAATNGRAHVEQKRTLPQIAKAEPSVMNNINNQSVALNDQMIHPIANLSPYQNKWVIRARVSNKSNIRKWSNSKGEGQLFSMDLIDESGEIRATAFRDLVDKFYNMIEVDKVYYISKCDLKLANKQFTSIKNDYEMTFRNDTVVQECIDSAGSIPKTQYSFIGIDKIAHIETGAIIDVIGVCKAAQELVTFQARSTGRELKKREVTLVDKTNTGIALTLWGDDAERFDGSTCPVIAIKGAKVGEFGGGKNVSLVGSSQMKINPDIEEGHSLRGWYDNVGKEIEVSNISARSGTGFQTQWMSFRQVQDSGMGNSEKGDYYQVMGTVLLIRSENAIYKSCPSENCNKKLIDLENDMYRCEKCNREYPNFSHRLICQMNVGDWSGNTWLSTFNADAETILGMTAKAVGEAVEADKDELSTITDRAHFKQFMFKCRAKMETYNDEARLKTVAVKVDPVNYAEYNKYLISRINELLNH